METRHPSVTLRFTQAIHQAAQRLGITLPAVPAGQDRVPLATQDALWEAFCSATPDPLAGLLLGLEIQAGHLDLAGLLLMSCETYGESLDALLDFYPIVGEGGDFQLRPVADQMELSYQAHYQIRAHQRVETVMAALLNLSHWNSGGHFRASLITLIHQPLDTPERYHSLLDCPVEFGAQRNAILFPRTLLDLPLVQANPGMRDQLRRLAEEQLDRLGDDSLAHKVASLVCQYPRWGKEKLAEHLVMSGRHLTRLLAEEGVTFKQIRDRELLRLAEEALINQVSISDLAVNLGFSDESAFSKAFRRWTGRSPAQHRSFLQLRPDSAPG